MVGAWSVRGFAMFSVIERDTGRWVGRIGPWQPEGWPGREVGWGVARAFAGRGYAHEAAVAAMDYAVDVLGWDHVIHTISGNLVTPWLTSRASSMNPVVVFASVLAWGWLWGIWGLLLGMPIMMVIKAVCDRVEDLKPIGELMGK